MWTHEIAQYWYQFWSHQSHATGTSQIAPCHRKADWVHPSESGEGTNGHRDINQQVYKLVPTMESPIQIELITLLHLCINGIYLLHQTYVVLSQVILIQSRFIHTADGANISCSGHSMWFRATSVSSHEPTRRLGGTLLCKLIFKQDESHAHTHRALCPLQGIYAPDIVFHTWAVDQINGANPNKNPQ